MVADDARLGEDKATNDPEVLAHDLDLALGFG